MSETRKRSPRPARADVVQLDPKAVEDVCNEIASHLERRGAKACSPETNGAVVPVGAPYTDSQLVGRPEGTEFRPPDVEEAFSSSGKIHTTVTAIDETASGELAETPASSLLADAGKRAVNPEEHLLSSDRDKILPELIEQAAVSAEPQATSASAAPSAAKPIPVINPLGYRHWYWPPTWGLPKKPRVKERVNHYDGDPDKLAKAIRQNRWRKIRAWGLLVFSIALLGAVSLEAIQGLPRARGVIRYMHRWDDPRPLPPGQRPQYSSDSTAPSSNPVAQAPGVGDALEETAQAVFTMNARLKGLEDRAASKAEVADLSLQLEQLRADLQGLKAQVQKPPTPPPAVSVLSPADAEKFRRIHDLLNGINKGK